MKKELNLLDMLRADPNRITEDHLIVINGKVVGYGFTSIPKDLKPPSFGKDCYCWVKNRS